MTDSMMPNLENDSNTSNTPDQMDLSNSLDDLDLSQSSSSEDKRSREESEPAAAETDESSPPSKRQRCEGEEEEDESQEEVIPDDGPGEGSLRDLAIPDEDDGEGSSRGLVIRDGHEVDESQVQQQTAPRDDGSNANSSSPVENNHDGPLPTYQQIDPDSNSGNTSVAEGSMESFRYSNLEAADVSSDNDSSSDDDILPPLVTSEEAETLGGDEAGNYDVIHMALALQQYIRGTMPRARRRRNRDRRPRRVSSVGLEWDSDMVTGREYLRRAMAEPCELSDEEGS